MLDHIGIPVSDVARSKQFFVAALAPLGYKVIMDFGEAVGMGAEAGPDFLDRQGSAGQLLAHSVFRGEPWPRRCLLSSRDRGRRPRQR
jgi:catechol 2,3-dioxygenase-like lactoylglutathione lyase family enzyme